MKFQNWSFLILRIENIDILGFGYRAKYVVETTSQLLARVKEIQEEGITSSLKTGEMTEEEILSAFFRSCSREDAARHLTEVLSLPNYFLSPSCHRSSFRDLLRLFIFHFLKR